MHSETLSPDAASRLAFHREPSAGRLQHTARLQDFVSTASQGRGIVDHSAANEKAEHSARGCRHDLEGWQLQVPPERQPPADGGVVDADDAHERVAKQVLLVHRRRHVLEQAEGELHTVAQDLLGRAGEQRTDLQPRLRCRYRSQRRSLACWSYVMGCPRLAPLRRRNGSTVVVSRACCSRANRLPQHEGPKNLRLAARGATIQAMGAENAVSREARVEALELLRTAYMLLLANHGQATSLLAQQAVDAHDGFQLPSGFDPLRSFDREWASQIAGRYAEAQLHVRNAVSLLGIARFEHLGTQLKIAGAAEAHFDGFFDLLALKTHAANHTTNQEFALAVQRLFEAIRGSDSHLAKRMRPLPSFDHDTGTTGISALGDRVGLLVGAPRFWSRSRWVAIIAAILLPVVFAGGVIAVTEHDFRSSPPYAHALRAAQSHPRAQQLLGPPIEPGWFTTGSLGPDTAQLDIPLRGSNADGSVRVAATKDDGVWTISELTLNVEGSSELVSLRKADQRQ